MVDERDGRGGVGSEMQAAEGPVEDRPVDAGATTGGRDGRRPVAREGSHREVLRAEGQLAEVASSLLLTLFPRHRLCRAEVGRFRVLMLDPPLAAGQEQELERYLHELVERPEWRARHALVREVRDRTGTHRELLTPLPPHAYQGGEALVGPFDDEVTADAWGAEHAARGYGHDAVAMAGGWMCDVFDVGDELAPAWEPGEAR
jgi:hypothetical protein